MSDFVASNTEYSNTDGNTEFYYEEKGRRSETAIGS